MIAIHHIDTQTYFEESNCYYSMLEPAANTVVTVCIDDINLRLKTIRSLTGTCSGCYFHENNVCPRNGHNATGLACNPADRSDNCHCIYVKAEDKKQRKK